MPKSARDALIGAACRALAFAFPSSPRTGVPAPRRVLVVKPGSLGDVLLAGPALATLRRGFPDSEIVQLVGTWAGPAAAGNPSVDSLLDCGTVGTPGAYSLGQYFSTVNRIRAEKFDAAAVLDRSPLMALLPWLAGIGVRAGLDSGGRGFALNYRAPVMAGRHEAELYLDVGRRMGLPVVRPEVWFDPPARARSRVRELLSGIGASKSFAVFAPGGGVNPGARRPDKRWAASGFAQAARSLRDRAGLLPVLVGDRDDRDAVAAVLHGIASGPHLDLSQKLSFAEVGALLERAEGFVANDSAIGHLGAAVGAAGVVVYTVTDPRIYGPPGSKVAKITAASDIDVVGAIVAALAGDIGPTGSGGAPGLGNPPSYNSALQDMEGWPSGLRRWS